METEELDGNKKGARFFAVKIVNGRTCDGNVDCKIFRGCAGNFATPRELRYLRGGKGETTNSHE